MNRINHVLNRHHAAALLLSAVLGLMTAMAAAQVSSVNSGVAVSTSTTNGETVVTLNGAEVWKGKAANPRTISNSTNGRTLAAVLDGERILWESEPGAAAKVAGTKPHHKASANSGIILSSTNGETVATLNGVAVWKGKAANPRAFSSTINGQTLAAVLDGERILWESEPGAAAKVAGAKPGHKSSANSSVAVTTTNGETVVTLDGVEVWKGKAANPRAFSSTINGQTLAAVLDGDRVLWESEPGAAAKVAGAIR